MAGPIIVAVDAAAAATTCAALAAAGWTVVDGSSIPDDPWDLEAARCCVAASVTSMASFEALALAAARGAAIVLVDDGGLPSALLDDLWRIAPITTSWSAPPRVGIDLTDDQRVLLSLIAQGQHVKEAAAAAFLSLRSAQRCLADVRTALGVKTTQHAIARLVALGVLDVAAIEG